MLCVEGHHTADRLRALIRVERHPKVVRRLILVLMAKEGHPVDAICSIVCLAERQIFNWLLRYNTHGIDGLRDKPGRGRRPRLSPEQATRLEARIQAGPTDDDPVVAFRGPDVQDILRDEFGVDAHLSTVYDWMHEAEFEPLRPRPVHPEDEPDARRHFREVTLPEAVACAKEKHPDKKIEVWTEDEARVGQKGRLTWVWAKKGSAPEAAKQTGYESVWVTGAVCPETGEVEAMMSDRMNTGEMNDYLERLSEKVGEKRHAVLVCDQAGFHTAKALKVPGNISVVLLPPRSPQLNPVEKLWQVLRDRQWSFRVCENKAEVERMAAEGWCKICLNRERIRSICGYKYLINYT